MQQLCSSIEIVFVPTLTNHWYYNTTKKNKNIIKTYYNLIYLPTNKVSPNKSTSGGGTGGKDDINGLFSTTASVADLDENAEINKFISSGQLTQYVYNLRMWIACTILQRVDAEIQKTNVAFAQNTHADCRGFSDIQIGKVGLDRLKKTANVPAVVAVYVPMLPMLLPFLEISTNQEYLVQRIRDLAKGCVLGEYRWNGGGTYGGVAWDEHLPTDSAVIFLHSN